MPRAFGCLRTHSNSLLYLLLAFVITIIEVVKSKRFSKSWFFFIGIALIQILSPFLFGFGVWKGELSSVGGLLGEARASSATAWLLVIFLLGWLKKEYILKGQEKVKKYVMWTWGILWIAILETGVGLLFTPESRVQNAYINESTEARIIIWEQGFEAFKEKPWLGWGPENFRSAWFSHFDNRLHLEANIGEVWFDRAHNFFIDTLVTTGVVGMAGILFMLTAYFSVIWRSRKSGIISSPESVVLTTIPFVHILQTQTSFDTLATYTLLAVIGAYVVWLEKQLHPVKSNKKISVSVGVGLLIIGVLGLSVFSYPEYTRQKALRSIFSSENSEEQVGIDIMKRALEGPIRQICSNAGVEPSIIVQKVLEGKNDFGYDARNNEYVNMFKAGIIDPAKVARVAVENAASISGLLLTTEAAITEKPEENNSPMPGAPDMGMGGMGGMM